MLSTPLGPMIAIASHEALYLLAFVGRRGLKRDVERLHSQACATSTPGSTHIIVSIEAELKAYFAGELKTFQTPIFLMGSPFQKNAWDALCQIPYGETRSYLMQAESIGNPAACRAVANANGSNQLAIVIPCHRVIHNNGALGGYASGLACKQWLIDHEKQHKHL